jgi:prefoldin subunit 5
MNDLTPSTSNFIDSMGSNVNVGMNEVVSVFVAKYEDGLFAKKDELSKKIKTVKQELADLDKRLIKSVNQDQYVTTIALFELKSKVMDVSVVWKNEYGDKKDNNKVIVNVGLFSKEDKTYPDFSKKFTTKISQEAIEIHSNLESEVESLNSELLEVMTMIKSVSRKERQIRGRISEMKLEQSGFADLMNNPEMVKLIEIK